MITTRFEETSARGVVQVEQCEHWNGTYVDARSKVARYVAANGLTRNAYGDTETLYRDGVAIGHYQISR